MGVATRAFALFCAGSDAERGVEIRFSFQDVTGAVVGERNFFRKRKGNVQRVADDRAQFFSADAAVEGNVYRKRASLADLAFGFYASAHHFDNALGNGKPQSAPEYSAVGIVLFSFEWLEYAL